MASINASRLPAIYLVVKLASSGDVSVIPGGPFLEFRVISTGLDVLFGCVGPSEGCLVAGLKNGVFVGRLEVLGFFVAVVALATAFVGLLAPTCFVLLIMDQVAYA